MCSSCETYSLHLSFHATGCYFNLLFWNIQEWFIICSNVHNARLKHNVNIRYHDKPCLYIIQAWQGVPGVICLVHTCSALQTSLTDPDILALWKGLCFATKGLPFHGTEYHFSPLLLHLKGNESRII